MSTSVFILLILLLYAKWIFFCLLYPCLAGWGMYQNHKSSLLCKIAATPYWCIDRLLRNGGERFVIFTIAAIPSVHLRKLLYQGLGAHIGPKTVFHFRTEIRQPWTLTVGKGSIIGDNALLDARSGLHIGRNVNLSSNVSIYTLQHDHRDARFGTPQHRKMAVEIDDRVWIGANVVILPGVHIGEGAVCCAGCVVTQDVPPYAVVAGIPAKQVNERPRNLTYEFNGKSCRIY